MVTAVSVTHFFHKQVCERLLAHDVFVYSLGGLVESLQESNIIIIINIIILKVKGNFMVMSIMVILTL